MMVALICALSFGIFARAAWAEDSIIPKTPKVAIAQTNAKILRRLEVKPNIFTETEVRPNQILPDISTHSCDPETRQLVKNCVQMILEIQ